jgi:putative flippase GtrA
MSMSRLRELAGHATVVRLRRFVVVGAGAATVQQGLLWSFVEQVGLWYVPAAAVAIEITILLQYVVNNSWTFRPSRHRTLQSYARGLVRTNIVRGTAIPIQTGLLYALVTSGGLGYLVANLVAIFVTGFYRYYLDSRWTWRI